jgi:hypothetical protein
MSEAKPIKSVFETLAAIDVGSLTKKKGKFTYLSWSYAVDTLLRHYPGATWEVKRFDGLPFLKTENGYFVEVAVTVDGVTRSHVHPVLNEKNSTIDQPNAFQINTSTARCLTKAIALHGLGLYIYNGEDVPLDGGSDEDETAPPGKPALDPKVMQTLLDGVAAIKTTYGLNMLYKESKQLIDKDGNEDDFTRFVEACTKRKGVLKETEAAK